MPDRILDVTDGRAMVVSDLHGDRDAFDRYVSEFRARHAEGDIQRLILLGDLIHYYGPPQRDRSLSMVLDVIALQESLGPDRVIMVLGNHEMPHIYGVSLAKGEIEFTPRFEHTLGPHRDRVLAFFRSLPFYVRTAAGVLLSHAGPSLEAIEQIDLLRHFDHESLLCQADRALAGTPDLEDLYKQYGHLYGTSYAEEARYSLAVSGPEDPRYPHLLRAFVISQQSAPFKALWDALFTQNEWGLTEHGYLQTCTEFLHALSEDAPAPQRVLVSGHMVTPTGGYMLVNRSHLRLSSATHARPREAGTYLLLDCAHPVRAASDLLPNLRSVFKDEFESAF